MLASTDLAAVLAMDSAQARSARAAGMLRPFFALVGMGIDERIKLANLLEVPVLMNGYKEVATADLQDGSYADRARHMAHKEAWWLISSNFTGKAMLSMPVHTYRQCGTRCGAAWQHHARRSAVQRGECGNRHTAPHHTAPRHTAPHRTVVQHNALRVGLRISASGIIFIIISASGIQARSNEWYQYKGWDAAWDETVLGVCMTVFGLSRKAKLSHSDSLARCRDVNDVRCKELEAEFCSNMLRRNVWLQRAAVAAETRSIEAAESLQTPAHTDQTVEASLDQRHNANFAKPVDGITDTSTVGHVGTTNMLS